MLFEHEGKRPQVADSAYVAPTAVLCGDVRVGADSRILFAAVLTAESGSIEVGERCIVMENALVRGRDSLSRHGRVGVPGGAHRYSETFGRHRGDRLLD